VKEAPGLAFLRALLGNCPLGAPITGVTWTISGESGDSIAISNSFLVPTVDIQSFTVNLGVSSTFMTVTTSSGGFAASPGLTVTVTSTLNFNSGYHHKVQ